MNRIYQRFAVAVASTTIFAIIGSISRAEAFQFFSDRTQWEAALNAPTKTLDFGERRLFSEPTVFPNGASASVNSNYNIGLAQGTKIGASYYSSTTLGSVRGQIDVKLPSPVNALGFDGLVEGYGFPSGGAAPFYTTFITQRGTVSTPYGISYGGQFYGVISEQNDPLLTDLRITRNFVGASFFGATNISYKSVSVPEGSSTLGIVVAFGTFGLSTAFLRRQKQYKSTTAIN